jgi:hypothetical protein
VKLGVRWPGDTDAVPLDRDASQLCDPGLVFSSRKSACEVPQALGSRLQAKELSLTLRKPGNKSTVVFTMNATGEEPFDATINVTTTRFEARAAAAVAANGPIRADEPSISAFGLHIELARLPPAATWRAHLGYKFEDTSHHDLTLWLACDGEEKGCVADGDVITAAVQVASPQDARLRSEVLVTVHVQSLMSCLHSRDTVRIEPDAESVPTSTPIRVRFFAKDADDLPVSFTRVEMNVLFADHKIPFLWSRGSNEYVADVSAELTSQPGRYNLVISASSAWNETAGQVTSCELLSRTIEVTQAANLQTWMVLAAAIVGCILLVLGTVIYVRRHSDRLQAMLVMILTETGAPSCVSVPHE